METKLILSKQEEIQNKLALINKALSELQDTNATTFKTNGMFTFSPNGNAIDIKYNKSVQTLLEMVSFLNAKESGYIKAADEMGLDTFPEFQWAGYTPNEWKHDIKIRISVLTSYERKRTLLEAKKVLENYVTEETKMLNDLKVVDNILKL
jgi:hypothetical protein